MTRLPFIRIVKQENFDDSEDYGGKYYVVDDQGICEEIGMDVRLGPNQLVYERSDDFTEKYMHFFPVGTVSVWKEKEHFDAWITKMIWFSFLCCSRQNIGPCWFVKDITDDNAIGYQLMSFGYEAAFQGSSRKIWVLLKIGSKIWPVEVINNYFYEGWNTFWSDHGLQVGYKLVFGFDREWMFDVTVLDANLDVVEYKWSTPHNLINIFPEMSASDAVRTSCAPSFMFTGCWMMQFGYVWGSANSFIKMLTTRLAPFVVVCNIEPDEQLSIRMHRTCWVISGGNGRFCRTNVKRFLEELDLQPLDFVLVTVFGASDIRVIVFNKNGLERVYSWC